MNSPQPRSLVVKCTVAYGDRERCMQAFTVAATAQTSGVSVSLWLTGEAAWFGVPGKAEAFVLAQSPPLADLRDAVLAGGSLTVCTQCAARRGIVEADLLAGTRLAGAATFVEECLRPGVQALVY